jgi:2-polyprenyl-3-methyl-5-hydroxy-6-metoxy-1,4-benzoquinol methylase
MNYLQKNEVHWQQGCPALNVESHVFRPYGVIFRDLLGISGENHERLLDFGCGGGTNSLFFKSKGFDVFGVDISLTDLNKCKKYMPDISNHFLSIDAKPDINDIFFGGKFDVVIAIHSMYYYNDKDLEIRLKSLYNMMNPGGIIYVTMIGTKSKQFQYSELIEDGLYKVTLPSKGRKRLIDAYQPHYKNFTKDKHELIKKLNMFDKLHVGHFEELYSEDGPAEVNHVFHYTYIGQKGKNHAK